ERFPSLRGAVEETRAAGVLVTLVAQYVFVRPRLVVDVTPGLTAAGKEKVQLQVIAALQTYVDGLTSGQAADGQAMQKAVEKVADVQKAAFKEVLTWKSDVGKPAAEALADEIVTALAAVPQTTGNDKALQQAIVGVLTDAKPAAPTGSRTPDRGVLQGAADGKATGARATDAEVEKAAFQVVPDTGWFVALDMGPQDVVIEEAGGADQS